MMRRINGVDLDDFTHHYLVTAIWSSHIMLPVAPEALVDGCMDVDDEHPLHGIADGEPYDAHFGLDDFTVEALRSACKDCAAFQATHDDDLCDEDDEQTGHDFFLTRNGHGAGYWETPDYEENKGLRLTAGCEAYAEIYIFVDDEGALHFE